MMRLVHAARSPFEIFILAAIIVSGVGGLVDPAAGSRIIQALPHWEQITWYGGTVAAGTAAMIGATTRRLMSLFLERTALDVLAAWSIAYTGIVLVAGGAAFAYSTIVTLGAAAACVARARQVSADIRHILEGR